MCQRPAHDNDRHDSKTRREVLSGAAGVGRPDLCLRNLSQTRHCPESAPELPPFAAIHRQLRINHVSTGESQSAERLSYDKIP